MLGSLFGSGLRAACAGDRQTAAVSRPRASPQLLRPIRALFPILDFEFGLLRALVIGDLEFQILGTHTLFETDIGRAPVITIVRTLAVEERDQFVLTSLQIADVQPLHAALEQRGDFTRGVQ